MLKFKNIIFNICVFLIVLCVVLAGMVIIINAETISKNTDSDVNISENLENKYLKKSIKDIDREKIYKHILEYKYIFNDAKKGQRNIKDFLNNLRQRQKDYLIDNHKPIEGLNKIEKPIIQEVPKNFTFNLTFTGDMMLASYKNQTTVNSFNEYSNNHDPSYFLEKVKPYFENDDYTIVNLENVLTDNNLKEISKNHSPAYWYRSKTSNINILTSSSVECVSLANNHTGDYGNQGRNDTIETVENAGLLYGIDSDTLYLEKNGYTIAVICNGLWGEWQADSIISRIHEAEEKSDFQIVFYHGGKERIHSPEEWKIRASRKLVDNGADLVIGNHPHVLQPIETYNGVEIIYSMGNFCYGGSSRPENRTIIYKLNLTISNDGVLETKESEIIPCYIYTGNRNNYQPAPIENDEEKQKVLDFMNWKVDSPI